MVKGGVGGKETIKNYKKKNHSLNLTMLFKKAFWDGFLSKLKVPQGDTPQAWKRL